MIHNSFCMKLSWIIGQLSIIELYANYTNNIMNIFCAHDILCMILFFIQTFKLDVGPYFSLDAGLCMSIFFINEQLCNDPQQFLHEAVVDHWTAVYHRLVFLYS